MKHHRPPAQGVDLSFGNLVLGRLVDVTEEKGPLIVIPDLLKDEPVMARATVELGSGDVGCTLAVMFESGNIENPIVIGRISQPKSDVHDLSAEREVTIRCGKASITLTREGKIILRGTYISSRSSGVNRIKGGSVHLN